MKPDPDYIKRILDVAEAHPEPFFDVNDFDAAGLKIDDRQFIFHLLELADRGLIRGASRDGSMGMSMSADSRKPIFSVVPLRLTAQGHDFAAALREPRVTEKVKAAVKEFGMGAGIQVAASLISAYAQTHVALLGG